MAFSDSNRKNSGKRKFTPKTLQIRKYYKKDCVFCNEGKEPDYKNYKELKSYVSERARILGRVYTGLCSKHQVRLASEVKRARHLGLLPYAPSTV